MRYAIYYTPPADHPLTLAAAGWLGRNAFDGSVTTVNHAFDDLVQAPRRYGFHATLKAPFSLKAGYGADDLADRFVSFCMENRGFSLPALKLARIGSFLALVNAKASSELDRLSSNAVEAFEPFRAALSDEDIARRNPQSLSPQQRAYLEKWGYPYVFDEFRFHMTLTGPVPDARMNAVEEALLAHFGDHLGKPHDIETCALFVERDQDKHFVIDTFSRLAR